MVRMIGMLRQNRGVFTSFRGVHSYLPTVWSCTVCPIKVPFFVMWTECRKTDESALYASSSHPLPLFPPLSPSVQAVFYRHHLLVAFFFSLTSWKSKLRSCENLVSRSTQKPEQHLKSELLLSLCRCSSVKLALATAASSAIWQITPEIIYTGEHFPQQHELGVNEDIFFPQL